MEDYKKVLKGRVLDKLRDLKEKIETEEVFPDDREQDIEFLCEADDRIDEILNAWYY